MITEEWVTIRALSSLMYPSGNSGLFTATCSRNGESRVVAPIKLAADEGESSVCGDEPPEAVRFAEKRLELCTKLPN